MINYESIIHPLWGVPRLAADGVTNATCNSCHSPTDAWLPHKCQPRNSICRTALRRTKPLQFNSYRELLFSDNQQELLNGVLVDRLVQATDANGNPLFQMDGNGNLILDVNGDPIPVLVTVTTSASMSAGGRGVKPALLQPFCAGCERTPVG